MLKEGTVLFIFKNFTHDVKEANRKMSATPTLHNRKAKKKQPQTLLLQSLLA